METTTAEPSNRQGARPITNTDVTSLDVHSRLREWFQQKLDNVDELHERYVNAHPFPHIVMDNFLPEDIAEALLENFPGGDDELWTKLPTEDQKGKFATKEEHEIPDLIRAVIFELNSGLFLKFLQRLTGIPELIVDAKLSGGGLHRIQKGGKLSVHVDFSHHPTNGLNRRLNLLIYLNKNWREEYGGHFELWKWKKNEKTSEVKVLPIFNRCAIFSTSPYSYHGHPQPLACPENITRKSLALYYFSNGRPQEESQEHNTLFKTRPGDDANLGNSLVRFASSGLFRDLMPPILYRGLRAVWNRKFTSGSK